MYVCAHACALTCPERPVEGVRFPGAGITGAYEPVDRAASILAAGPCLQLPHRVFSVLTEQFFIVAIV